MSLLSVWHTYRRLCNAADIRWSAASREPMRCDCWKMGAFLGVVSDMRTPGGVDGGQVHAWIARHRPDLASRIIFITGDIANEETVATLHQTGAPCVEKPFRVSAIYRRGFENVWEGRVNNRRAKKIFAFAC